MFDRLLLSVAALCAVACAGTDQPSAAAGSAGTGGTIATGGATAGGPADDGSLIYPANINVTARPGNNSIFSVIALTLLRGDDGFSVYAAVKNVGDLLGCNASFSVDLHDENDEIVASNVSGLMVRHFYRFNDGSGTIAGCVAPGDVTMVAIPSLTPDPPTAEVHSVVYQSAYWGNLDVSPIDGVTLSDVRAVTQGAGQAYAGTLKNGFDREIEKPTVAVFTLNSVGRPLAIAHGESSVMVPPGGTWDFETNSVEQPGVAFDAYPLGGS